MNPWKKKIKIQKIVSFNHMSLKKRALIPICWSFEEIEVIKQIARKNNEISCIKSVFLLV